MTTSELKNITSNFSDIKPLIQKQNDLQNHTNKVRRRLKTQLNKYCFLKDLVDIDSNGDKLVDSIVLYFKELGFKNVENVDKKYKDEDIRLWVGDLLIIFEVTGIDTPNPKDDKAHRISKHIPVLQEKYPDLHIFGVFIVNHDNKKHFSKRDKKPFREKLTDIAKAHKYTLTTTVDLLNAFLNIKKGELTETELIKELCSGGELKVLGT
jgi:hypothetical protein